MIATRSTKRGTIEVYPKFVIKKSSDLMIRGGDFYAIWIDERGLWSTDEQDALQLIDRELDRYAEEHRAQGNSDLKVLHMWDAECGMIDSWHKYCQKQMRDSFHVLDEKLIFANAKTNKKDYASKRLAYPLEACEIPAYTRLMSVLYSDEERLKIEWAIGSIVSGESKKLQKFMVLYGAAGTGKSTVLNIVQQLFDGYYAVFDARALGSSSNSFALEAFKTSPLVAIQHDGDLSKIEDNTRLNSLVSHELMTVNEKFKSTYSNKFKCFLFMGTNKPVKITDAKSGLIRRLIDVSPSGNTLDQKEYKKVVKQVEFELGGIAHYCQELYLASPGRYDDYMPVAMLGASNDFYNFVVDVYHIFKKDDGTTLKAAWEMYKTFCDETKVSFPHSQRIFKEELKTYFWDYKERFNTETGERVRSFYSGFRTDKLDGDRVVTEMEAGKKAPVLNFQPSTKSILDNECGTCLAQYANTKETPPKKWDSVTTRLASLDPSILHYVMLPANHIVIDFDISGPDGGKSLDRNIEEASKWPATYAELSKSGKGIHLHYIYNGDVTKLSAVYEDHIEVKVPIGNSSLRRKLTKCNNLPIATISSGLPLKGETKMVNFDAVTSEKGLRALIRKNLLKEIHPGTKPSIDFIYKILDDAYNNNLSYDVSDMYNIILAFAASSSNQSDYCIKLVNKMQLKSDEPSVSSSNEDPTVIFYDVEVFPNLFICNWKIKGKDKPVVRMINPNPNEIEDLIKMRLVGFNCRRYDNHILYAKLMGYDNEQLYELSQKIINGSPNCFFGEAYNLSYTDVYDFASAGNKKGLKKWEIELGLKHHELGLPWDQPVPEELWLTVAEYCDDDVLATEEVFDHLIGDWTARQILADVAGMTVNDTTNALTTRIIFGTNRKPQDQFNYRNLAMPVKEMNEHSRKFLESNNILPIPFRNEFYSDEHSILPFFPGYTFEAGKSTYLGEEVGEGGYVYSEPGIYGDVAVLDVASMHPSTMIDEVLFGPTFTQIFKEIKDTRLAIKHGDHEKAKTMLDGKLAPYLDGKYADSDLANALKTAINSAYGLTAASFDNAFKDRRNKDNIVAKRGALFMLDLKKVVQQQGFVVAHIKTDSIKIPDATPEIIKFVTQFGRDYGYEFEHESTYDKMCLVNDAVYIAKYATSEKCQSLYGYIPGDNKKHPGEWTATGTQFAVPYVFKTLFSKDSILFEDLCETKSVTSALYLDMNEDLPDVSEYEKELGKLRKKDPPPDPTELEAKIAEGHNYRFIGKVGSFCPIKDGNGGGLLMREKDGKYYAATGSKGYRWLEAEMVFTMDKMDDINRTYYDDMVTEAIKAISLYGDFEMFSSEDSYICDPKANENKTCLRTYEGCPYWNGFNAEPECKLGYTCLPF